MEQPRTKLLDRRIQKKRMGLDVKTDGRIPPSLATCWGPLVPTDVIILLDFFPSQGGFPP